MRGELAGDPKIGSWLTPDPLGFVDGPNVYAYVHNNPLTHIDPYGLRSEEPERINNNHDSFWNSFAHGAAEDASWGLSKKVVGEHNPQTTKEYLGYYTGTACSMGAGLLYGSTELKASYYVLKCLGKIGKSIKSGVKCLSTGRKVQRYDKANKTANKTNKVAENLLSDKSRPKVDNSNINPNAKNSKDSTSNNNPFDGPVSKDVIVVDSKSNGIPVKAGEAIKGSRDGKYLQVETKEGIPTGLRKDGPHKSHSHNDPRALVPHGHVPGVTNQDGTPWLPIYY